MLAFPKLQVYTNESAVFGISSGARFYVVNSLQALDAPQEYYIDAISLDVFLIPPVTHSGLTEAEVTVSAARGALISMVNVHHTIFENLNLSFTRGDAVVAENCTFIAYTNLTVKNVGLGGLYLPGGANNTVQGCSIAYSGGTGISISGGNRTTLTPAHHVIEDNVVHSFSRRCFTYTPALNVDGVGIRAARNEFFDAPHSAILNSGNNNIFEYNIIHHTVKQVVNDT